MTLRGKSLLIIGSALSGLILIIYGASRFALMKGFTDIEIKDARHELARVHAFLASQSDGLDILLVDWSNWDDTYEYIVNRNEAYEKSNLSIEALTSLKINLIAFFDLNGNVVCKREIDQENKKEVPLDPSIEAQLVPDSLLVKRKSDHDVLRGILTTAKGPMLIASRPILKSNETGPNRGTVVMGYYLDGKRTEMIQRILVGKLRTHPIEASRLSTEARGALSTLTDGTDPVVRLTPQGSLDGYTLIRDVFGTPALLVEISLPRDIHHQGELTIRTLTWLLLAAGLIVGFLVLRVLHTQVVSRVATLESTARRIAESGDLSQRVAVTGSDELTRLTVSINRMLASLEVYEQNLHVAKASAEEANRLKSRFLANISHEVRTPLNCIIGFTEAILSSRDTLTIHGHARTLLDESETLLSLINDILDHAKIEAGRMIVERRIVDLPQVLQGIINAARVLAQTRSLEFRTEMPNSLPQYVYGDGLRIRQVLMNLLSNAVKFTPKGSVTLRIELTESADPSVQMRFSVIDTGIGIPKEKQGRVFLSFTQVDDRTTRQFGGTGLGTSVARSLVQLMGGEMGLESEPNVGSTFWFTLTLETVPQEAIPHRTVGIGPSERSDPQGCLPAHILLAEDYPSNRQIVQMHLESAGHTVTVVEDGEQAVSACKSFTFDMILMDVCMPKMDGYQAAFHIRALSLDYAWVPIVALTADADLSTKQACLRGGMNDVLTKPIRRDALLKAVDRWLGYRRASESPPLKVRRSGTEAPKTSEAPLDYRTALDEFGSEELVRSLLRQFVQNVESQIALMRSALSRTETEVIRKEAHTIKGGAATLTAYDLAETARQVEQHCISNSLEALEPLIEKLEHEFDRLREYIDGQLFLEGMGTLR